MVLRFIDLQLHHHFSDPRFQLDRFWNFLDLTHEFIGSSLLFRLRGKGGVDLFVVCW